MTTRAGRRTGSGQSDGGGITLGRVVLAAADRYADSTALRPPPGATMSPVSYAQLGRMVRDVARGLIALGVESGERVSILSDTRAEWTLADFGSLCGGAVVTPIYQTSSPEECAYVLGHAESRVVFCEGEQQLAKIEAVRAQCPSVSHVILLEGEAPGAMSMDGLRERGSEIDEAEIDRRLAAVEPLDTATLIYTSGTTGPPKGCMITHRNFVATMHMYRERLELDSAQPTIYMFLPLAHALARVAQTVCVEVGGTLAFWGANPRAIVEELRQVQPTHLPAVPRIFEKLQAAVADQLESQGRLRRAVSRWAIRRGRELRALERRGERPGPLLRLEHALGDRLVLSKVRAIFGGRLRLGLVGAAPIDPGILEFFDACGVLVLEGYGMTESCAAGTVNAPAEFRFGTVGRAMPGTEVAVADDGEVLLQGPNVFRGYFKNPEASQEALSEGWLHTGDLGELSEDGYLRVTGRKKELIITSSGKNITPTNIENALRATRWIAEAVVYGDRRPYLVALLTLDRDELPALAEARGTRPELAEMAADEGVRTAIQRVVDEVNSRFARIEQVKRFAILDHDLTQAAGELTPTMKVKRVVVYERYAETLAALYAE